MINLYLLGGKGYFALKSINLKFLSLIDCVIIGSDKNVLNDYSTDIKKYCETNNITYLLQNKTIVKSIADYSIAIGWRWLIKDNSKLIVFHDSLLPRLRGFNPLVTALINGDNEVGVSILFGTEDYDIGEIIIQKKIKINYPIKIKVAIEQVSFLYGEAINDLIYKLKAGIIHSEPQDELLATYSLWRDEADYVIDWNNSAEYIKRFIDAVGYPYKGAYTTWNNIKLYVKDSILLEDVFIENRKPGKVLFKKNDTFIIVCGSGLLGVKDFFDENGQKMELVNFRLRFT